MRSFFNSLLANDSTLQDQYWQELNAAYAEPHRAYHTLHHIAHLIDELQRIEALLKQPQAVYLAAFYHDAIYDPSRTDNETQSARLATERLPAAGVPDVIVQQVTQLIAATQHHEANGVPDADLFLDADLAILGAVPECYQQYAAQIRQEYSMYPDAAYNMGRSQVLRSFLEKPQIFQTAVFGDRYEAPARQNIRWELTQLSGTPSA